MEIYEDETRRVIRVMVTNLEDNQTESADITVSKTVERSKPSDDGSYISVRMNSYGKPTYTVPANDEDLLNKEWALVSKMRRNCGNRHVPGDIQAEAEEIIRSVRMDEAARDPDAERRDIADGFAKLNVPVDELTDYVGHDLATCSPKELADLRTVWGSVRDGEATWASLLEHRRTQRAAGTHEKPPKGVNAVKEKIKAATPPSASSPSTEAGKPEVTAIDAIAKLDGFTDEEVMALWADAEVPDAVKADDRFTKKYRARMDEFKAAAKKK